MRKKLNIILDIAIVALIITATYSWMVTEPSYGEVVDYDKRLVVPDSDVDVEFYIFKDSNYVKQLPHDTEPLITTDDLEPGKNQKYRFDLTNKKDVPAVVKIVFTEITGDVDLLAPVTIFTNTSPSLFNFRMINSIVYNEEEGYYYIPFMDSVTIPANSTLSIYWSIGIDSSATNEIEGSSFNINKVTFIKP